MNEKERALMAQIRRHQEEGEGAWSYFTPSNANERVARNDRTGKLRVEIGNHSVTSQKSFPPKTVLSAAEEYFEILREKGA